MINPRLTRSDGEGVMQVGVEQMGVMVDQVVEHHLTGCHVVLLTAAPHSPVFAAISR